MSKVYVSMRRSYILVKKILLIILFAVLLQGCASGPKYKVSINSISSGTSVEKNTYTIYSSVKDVTTSDLQFKEYSTYVKRALNQAGFTEADNKSEAHIAIFLNYGISEPHTYNYSYSVPTYGQTGIASSNTYGTINSYGSTATYSGMTTYTPSYGITGSQTFIGTKTYYVRFISLDAVDIDKFKTDKSIESVWRTTITSSGSSGDLRLIFPALIAAAEPYFGKNTGKIIDVELYDDDPEILKVKGEKPR